MPKFVIEREIPGAGKLTPEQLQAISQKSCGVLKSMGPQIQWLQSYVTDDKIYCIYIAPDEDTIRQHAQQGGFPANSIARVRSVFDPTTSEKDREKLPHSAGSNPESVHVPPSPMRSAQQKPRPKPGLLSFIKSLRSARVTDT